MILSWRYSIVLLDHSLCQKQSFIDHLITHDRNLCLAFDSIMSCYNHIPCILPKSQVHMTRLTLITSTESIWWSTPGSCHTYISYQKSKIIMNCNTDSFGEFCHQKSVYKADDYCDWDQHPKPFWRLLFLKQNFFMPIVNTVLCRNHLVFMIRRMSEKSYKSNDQKTSKYWC